MVGLPFDCLSNPLGAVRFTFEKAISSGFNPATSDGKDWGAIKVFQECLFDEDHISQVPILDPLNISRIQPNSLVRFRGMVQDMLTNEFYVGAFKDGLSWRTNKFSDVSPFPMGSSSETRIWERRLLYCVPVPGQNSWAMESSSELVTTPCKDLISQHGEKRQREDDTAATTHMVLDSELQGSPLGSKRMREDGFPGQSSSLQDLITTDAFSKQREVPGFDPKSLPCLVKVYDSQESDLKLNDVFEFIGVFTYDPEFPVPMDSSDALDEDALVQLPPSNVPCLHCIVHRKLATHDFISKSTVIEAMPSLIRGIRESLLGYLTTVLGNDCLAAQCILLHLLSQVHARVDSAALGKLSVNLTGFVQESLSVFGNQLNVAIQNLMPISQTISLTIGYLNTASLSPKKDYETNRLVTGVLQLAEGTHLTVDETPLDVGTLDSTGVKNVELLKNLMELQKVEYDFEYYKIDMSADVQMLILSEGKSNILPADLVLPFRPSGIGSSVNAETEALQTWRWYLATLKTLPHDIDLDMQKVIEDDLVAARQEDRNLGSQDFSRLLTIARLLTVSFGETRLTLELWQMAKELERQRKDRLKREDRRRRYRVDLISVYAILLEDPLCEWIVEDDDEPLLPTYEEWPEELEENYQLKTRRSMSKEGTLLLLLTMISQKVLSFRSTCRQGCVPRHISEKSCVS
ncbi:hypothetical protein GIB67_041181 [Kingdonia uniflora]|uniref:Mini-chromosome maintenance complex-binding protein n=1 Tax=Kingdonia uniflora TaxID=39325 RepID=A0A7J7LKF8_9MAGN|nr:hypothetical protein GIB67_041181 [Kingdonia uniflora]